MYINVTCCDVGTLLSPLNIAMFVWLCVFVLYLCLCGILLAQVSCLKKNYSQHL